MPSPKLDTESPRYVPETHLGNGIVMKATMAIEVRDRDIVNRNRARKILLPSIAGSEHIELQTGPYYSRVVKMITGGPRRSPELWLMQPRWVFDEHTHGAAEARPARQLGIPSLVNTGQAKFGIPLHKMPMYRAIQAFSWSSQHAADLATCLVAFDGVGNEHIAQKYYHATQQKLLAGPFPEVDLANLNGEARPQESIHGHGYADILTLYYPRLSPENKDRFRKYGPDKFGIVGENQIGSWRTGQMIEDTEYDLHELAATVDRLGSEATGQGEHFTFALTALERCVEAWRQDYRYGLTADQTGFDPHGSLSSFMIEQDVVIDPQSTV